MCGCASGWILPRKVYLQGEFPTGREGKVGEVSTKNVKFSKLLHRASAEIGHTGLQSGEAL